MKKIITTLAIIALTASFAQARPQKGGNGQPPKEAISACESKDEGSSCSMKSPRGDSAEGTCKKDGEYLACMPNNHREER